MDVSQVASRGSRWARLLIIVLAGALGAVLQVGAAQAAITATAVTSPSDPSYFYDPTGGAYGGFTVSGTTNSNATGSDQVDIDCHTADPTPSEYSVYQLYPLVTGVSVNADGSFSATVPYSALEPIDTREAQEYPNSGVCQIVAVPADTQPADLSSFTGPRVFLSYLALDYDQETGQSEQNFTLVAPQPADTDVYTGAGECGLTGSYLNDATVPSLIDGQSFACNDATGSPSGFTYDEPVNGSLEVDGIPAYAPAADRDGYQIDLASGQPGLQVSATQNPTNGDMTIQEVDPLYECGDPDCASYVASGVVENRTIQQTDSGRVVLITDTFASTDGDAHSVTLDLENQQCFRSSECDGAFHPNSVGYEFPGDSTYQTYSNGNLVSVTAQPPGTIYIAQVQADILQTSRVKPAVEEPSTVTAAPPYGAITYFTAPSGDLQFQIPSDYSPYFFQNSFVGEWDVSVPAGGSGSLSFAYSTDSTTTGLAADVAAATALESQSSNGGGSSDGSGSGSNGSGSTTTTTTPTTTTTTPTTTTTTTTVTTVSPSPTVNSQLRTTWPGPTYHPIANTGAADRHGHTAEHLKGSVVSGSASVSYYFDYGTTRAYGHRTKTFKLPAGESVNAVQLTAKGLTAGTTYHYRLVALGADGHASGADRTFTAGQ